ncbi:MAG: M81 family metallopeptidase [Gammaproteobacteria bacterium]|nr:M81 family metallopeptidase [Gammaproteobacteria bacterium]
MGSRIAIGGIWHETNTFAAGLTTLDDFTNYQFAVGHDVLQRYQGTGTEIGGMTAAAADHDLELVPTIYAAAVPAGTISADALNTICDEMVQRLQTALPLDGMLIALHGAAVAEGIEDADAYVLAQVRSVIGTDVPIVATFDFHANLGEAMVAGADVLIGYDTYPHVDMAERGREAAAIITRLLKTGSRPATAFRKIPIITAPQKQPTDEPPMSEIIGRLAEIEERPGIVCGSVAMGFPYADVAELGASVLVYAEDKDVADSAADELAAQIWKRRQSFHPTLTHVKPGVAEAVASNETPVVLVDPADNVGGGSAGDGTVALDALLRLSADGAVIVIADPQAVAIADGVGVGGVFDAEVGAKTDRMHGEPVRVRGKVRLLADGHYRHKGTYMTGYETSMGRTAVVDATGVQIVLTSLRTMPFDAEQLRCVGIEPEQQKIIVVKSAIAWRAAYGDIAKHVIVIDTPGVCASNLERFNYQRRPSPIYPLEPETQFGIEE